MRRVGFRSRPTRADHTVIPKSLSQEVQSDPATSGQDREGATVTSSVTNKEIRRVRTCQESRADADCARSRQSEGPLAQARQMRLSPAEIARVAEDARPRLLKTFTERCPGHDRALAEDLFQDAIVRIYHRLPGTNSAPTALWLYFPDVDAVIAYLHSVIETLLRDHTRRERRHPTVSLVVEVDDAGAYGFTEVDLDPADEPNWHAPSPPNPENHAMHRETAMTVVSVLSTFRPDERQLLISQVERPEGESDAPPATPNERVRLHRLRARLRERVEGGRPERAVSAPRSHAKTRASRPSR